MNDCKTLLSKLVEENNDLARAEMEKMLNNWAEDELLGALIEIQGETEEAEILLRALQLHQNIVDMVIQVGEKKDKSLLVTQDMDIEVVRGEMSRMAAELDKEDDVESRPNDSEIIVEVKSGAKGWSKWEGPWIPKPIGVV